MSSSRPSLLFLCQTLPFPPDSGVHNRSYNILRQLARDFEVTSLCFYRRSTRSTPMAVREGVAGLARLGPTEAFPIPQEYSPRRRILDHVRSLTTRMVYTRYVHESVPFRRRLEALLEQRCFDLVHMDSLDLSGYLPALSELPVVCTHHNCEHELLHRRALAERNPLARAYLRFQANRTLEEVARWAPRVALNVTVSRRDRDLLRDVAPPAKFIVVENGVDTAFFEPRPEEANSHVEPHAAPLLVFVGGSMWFPNRDALDFFVRDVLPLIRSRVGEVRVRWVGHADDAAREAVAHCDAVSLTGYVEDIRPHVREAACYVVPLRVGGGTRLKILDAWALGAPVVSTSVGAEGLELRPGENILIGNSAEEFAGAVARVVTDRGLRDQLRRGGRETAVRRYDWERVAESMRKRYLELASAGS